MLRPYKSKKEQSSVAGGGRLFRGGVVAVAGAGDELAAAARGDHFHLDGAVGAVAAGVGGIVGQNVLVANVVSDLLADAVHVIDVFREEGQAAGGRRHFLEGIAAGVVFAVGDDEENLLVLGSFFEMIKRAKDGVAQGGTSA